MIGNYFRLFATMEMDGKVKCEALDHLGIARTQKVHILCIVCILYAPEIVRLVW